MQVPSTSYRIRRMTNGNSFHTVWAIPTFKAAVPKSLKAPAISDHPVAIAAVMLAVGHRPTASRGTIINNASSRVSQSIIMAEQLH